MLFLDLAKAFDSIDHKLMLVKLRCLGFKPNVVTWFHSYFSNRMQSTVVNGTLSEPRHIECGVPQGSILGPLMFLCYINDLPTHVRFSTSYLYADDTAIVMKGKNVNDITHGLTSDLQTITKWFAANKLCLNAGKTKSMLFYNPQSFRGNKELLVFNNQDEIEQVTQFRYLGVELDSTLKFDKHVDYLRKKVNQRTRLLWKMRSYISKELALALYNSLIDPLFLYCNYVYDGMSLTSKRSVQVLQNSALRAVAKVNKRYSATALHDELQVEWLDIQRAKSTCTEVYKFTNGKGPQSLTDVFTPVANRRTLCSNAKICHEISRVKTKFSEKDFVYRGKKYWEKLPAPIQRSTSLEIFKSQLKSLHDVFEHIT